MQIIFNIIPDKRKLNLVKYNKNLQNQININLFNYKFFSGKYIIYEEIGKGKEYDGNDDKLLFGGEYKKGKRNKEGKEYYNGKLIFEGNYLNGKRNGKGKEYYIKDKLYFEGIYLNGKKWDGNIYDHDGKIVHKLKKGKGLVQNIIIMVI